MELEHIQFVSIHGITAGIGRHDYCGFCIKTAV